MLEAGDPVRGFFSTPPIRRREIETFWQALDADTPTVIAGDFNEEPGPGLALAFLAEQGFQRADPGPTATWEFQGTWRGHDIHLRLRLDHVVVSEHFAIESAEVVDAGGSDHRPVVATLARA